MYINSQEQIHEPFFKRKMLQGNIKEFELLEVIKQLQDNEANKILAVIKHIMNYGYKKLARNGFPVTISQLYLAYKFNCSTKTVQRAFNLLETYNVLVSFQTGFKKVKKTVFNKQLKNYKLLNNILLALGLSFLFCVDVYPLRISNKKEFQQREGDTNVTSLLVHKDTIVREEPSDWLFNQEMAKFITHQDSVLTSDEIFDRIAALVRLKDKAFDDSDNGRIGQTILEVRLNRIDEVIALLLTLSPLIYYPNEDEELDYTFIKEDETWSPDHSF